MKKLILAGAIIFQLTCYLQAQEIKYPKGAYMSFEENVNKAPSGQMDLQIIKRSKGESEMVGGALLHERITSKAGALNFNRLGIVL